MKARFGMRLMAAVAALVGPAFGTDGLRAGARVQRHGPAPACGGRLNASCGPRVAFTARSGRTIVRETVPGSDHERRLLRRRDARRV